MTKKILMALSCIAFLLASCKEKPQMEQSVKYAVMSITKGNVSTTDIYPATIKGRQDVNILPQVEGKIMSIAVKEGQQVKLGQTLFVIDQVRYRATLQTAHANLNAARANVSTVQLTYDGKKELYHNKVISLFDLQKARNALLTAKAQLQQAVAQVVDARNSLSYTVVKSPAAGIVGTLPYRVGTLVNSSMTTPLTTISDNSQVFAYFSLPENSMLQLVRQYGSFARILKAMPKVRLQLNDGSTYDNSGHIVSMSGVIDAQTGSIQMRAVFPNTKGLLHSGGAANVLMEVHMNNVISIPQSATYELQDKVYVYRVMSGKAVATLIKIKPIDENSLYVATSGLKLGDVIIMDGVSMIQDGQKINIKK